MPIKDITPRQLFFGSEARQNLLKGAKALNDAVGATLGPRGRHVLADESPKERGVTITKDGVTVARKVHLINIYENTGAKMLRSAAERTVDLAGDGTTTATILAYYLFEKGLQLVEANLNPVDIIEGMKDALICVTSYLQTIKRDIENEKDVYGVSYISCNNDPELAKLISEAMRQIGVDGIVHVEEVLNKESRVSVIKGLKIPNGLSTTSTYQVTDSSTQSWEKTNCRILATEEGLQNIEQFKSLVDLKENVLVVAKDVAPDVLKMNERLHHSGYDKICIIKLTKWGDFRRFFLKDIAKYTLGKALDANNSFFLVDQEEYLGKADNVIVYKNETHVIGGYGSKHDEEYDDYVNHVKSTLDEEEDVVMQRAIKERIANLTAGTAIISVGGETEEDIKEKKDRVDDAVNAVKCALKEGILPGGGTALAKAKNHLDNNVNITADKNPDYVAGFKLLSDSLLEPFVKILSNAGETALTKIHHVIKDNLSGYDAKNRKNVDNMFEEGIIDPYLVVVTALSSAIAAASTLLTTQCTINFYVQNGEDKDATIYDQRR